VGLISSNTQSSVRVLAYWMITKEINTRIYTSAKYECTSDTQPCNIYIPLRHLTLLHSYVTLVYIRMLKCNGVYKIAITTTLI
jgi:K+ transporter